MNMKHISTSLAKKEWEGGKKYETHLRIPSFLEKGGYHCPNPITLQ
jgi:hypothetical protein